MDIVLTPQAFFRAAIGKARALPAWPEFIHQTVEVAYPQFAQAYTNWARESRSGRFAGKAWSIYPRR